MSPLCRCSSPLLSALQRWRPYCAGGDHARPAAAVWSFGDGSNGALGSSAPLLDAYEPEKVACLATEVVSVAAGHYHSLALTAGGEVWSWGRNVEGQLGRGPDAPRDTWSKPERVVGLDNVHVRDVFASGVVSAAIATDGSLWVWGRSKRGQLGLGEEVIQAIRPSKVEALAGEDIVKVSFGWGHALALTKGGKISWGYAEDGRLGRIGQAKVINPEKKNKPVDSYNRHREISSLLEVSDKIVREQMEKEKSMPVLWEPGIVSRLGGQAITDIACGLDHSLILRDDCAVLSYGDNTYGQLGRSDTDDPETVPLPTDCLPISLSAGVGHSLALCRISTQGREEEATGVLSWGWNHCRQLGRSGREDLSAWVDGLGGERVVSVSAGRVHSMALTSKGEVWTWGSGRNGRLGMGSTADGPVPARVESLDGLEVLQAVSGADHNLLLIAVQVWIRFGLKRRSLCI